MKNIAIVSNNLQIGGVQKSLINLLREIHGKYSIDLYLADDENAYRDLVPNDVNVYRLGYPFRLFGISHAKARKEGGRVWIQSLLFRGITKVFGKKYVVPFIVKKTKWDGRRYDVAISYVHDGGDKSFYGGCNEFVLKRVDADKKISFMHGDFEKCGSNTLYNRKILMGFDNIVCVSRYCAERMKKVFAEAADKIVYVGNMIDYEELRRKSQDEPIIYDKKFFNIVTVARLSKEKGLVRCMPIIRALLDEGYRVMWHIVGDGAYRSVVESKIDEYRLRNNVVLYGERTNPYKYLTNADLFVLPSYEEAEGMVLKEALALKLPVLATNTGATKDIVEERYGIVCENNDEELFKSLYRVVTCGNMLAEKKQALIDAYRPSNKDNLEKIENIIEANIGTSSIE